MKRNPHPARGSRVTALGVSATAFVSIVTSLAWNTHQAEAAVNVTNPNTIPVGQTTPVSGATAPVPIQVATTSPVTPAATIAPTAPATTQVNKTAASTPAATVAPATPATKPKPVAVAPAKPAVTVVYTCMSPGGTTENPTSSGQCRSGYSLTKI
jgi:hypothetical protein